MLRFADLGFTFVAVAPAAGVGGLIRLAFNLFARKAHTLPELMTWLGIGAGSGMAMAGFAVPLAGMDSPLTWTWILSVLFGPAWSFWFGRLLLAGRWR